MSGHLRVYIGTPRPGARGLIYDCHMNTADGLTIVTGTNQPLYDTARVLAAKGVKGELELWDARRPFPRMRGNIERMARLTVCDTQEGIFLRRFLELSASEGVEISTPSARERIKLDNSSLIATPDPMEVAA